MSNSNRLGLPFIDAAQSQKHVTHNEALVALDALVHLAVKARNVSAPPASPLEGDRYLVPSGATGGFAGHANAIAAFDNGGWAFLAPKAGWRVYVEGEGLFLLFDAAGMKKFEGFARSSFVPIMTVTDKCLRKEPPSYRKMGLAVTNLQCRAVPAWHLAPLAPSL